jgi:hypothetical protein
MSFISMNFWYVTGLLIAPSNTRNKVFLFLAKQKNLSSIALKAKA